jgi:hypothetical protein
MFTFPLHEIHNLFMNIVFHCNKIVINRSFISIIVLDAFYTKFIDVINQSKLNP